MSRSASSAIPLYFQIERDLATAISDGTLSPGTQIPTEDALIARYGVSRATVRKAIQDLERLDLVEIRRGKGTFVQAGKLSQELALTGFVEDMVAAGLQPSAKVLGKEVVAASEEVAEHLALSVGADVMRIQRVRSANDLAMSLDETYLPIELGRKIAEHDLEIYPIFSLLEHKYDTPLVEADYRIESVAADAAVAQALAIAVGSPILRIERTSYTLDRKPVDYEKLFYRGDKIRLTTSLRRRPSPIPFELLPQLGSKKA
jgi:GntR family transcriptional regulator